MGGYHCVVVLLAITARSLVAAQRQERQTLDQVDWAPQAAIDEHAIQAALSKQVYLGDEPETRYFPATQAPSPSTTKAPSNKWGIDEHCHVVCRKLLCFGYGPTLRQICAKQRYKHECCEKYIPTTSTSTPSPPEIVPIEQVSQKPASVQVTIEDFTPKKVEKFSSPRTSQSSQATAKPKATTKAPTTKRKPNKNTKKVKKTTKEAGKRTKSSRSVTEAKTPNTSKKTSGCSNFTHKQDKCIREPGCEYSCATKTCESNTSSSIPKKEKHNKNEVCNYFYCTMDLCSCRACGLPYDSSAEVCESSKQICKKLKFAKDDCLRPNQLYAQSGTICESGKEKQDFCQVEETIVAINLGTKFSDHKYKDSRNITHLSDDTVPFDDKHKTRKKQTWIPKKELDVDDKDKVLYESVIHGDPKLKPKSQCVSYKVKLWRVGKYELALKLADHIQGKLQNRMFNVLFNKVPILKEIDITAISANRTSIAEIFLNFAVIKSGSMLSIPGFKDTKITDGYATLSFCYGGCAKIAPLRDYSVAAFSIIRFTDYKSDESKKCSSYKDSACTARKYACQYNVVTGEAIPLQDCTKTFFSKMDCIRNNAFYLHGGALCYNQNLTSGDCHLSDVLAAVNMRGGRINADSRGVHYKSERDSPPVDEHKMVRGKALDKLEVEVTKRDKDLFLTYAYGEPKANVTKNNCIYWNINVGLDGMYEISIKTMDNYYNHHGSRTFSVKINSEVVIQELDLLGLAAKGTPVDIIINFEVLNKGGFLHVRGFPIRPFDGKIKLAFCYGNCKTESKNWVLSAFYVGRLEKKERHLQSL